jgi:phosphate starvation-inducible protein PhoH and related proteins
LAKKNSVTSVRTSDPGQPKLDIKLWNAEQEAAWDVINRNSYTILTGPAGTAKTFVAVAYAVEQLLRGQFKQIVICRPAVQAEEDLGFLPGLLDDKVKPYLRPIYDALTFIAGDNEHLKKIFQEKVKIETLAYMRGRSFWNSVVIVDEAQNVTLSQMKLVSTRLARDSKIVFAGDVEQSDLVGRKCILRDAAQKLQGLRGFGWYEFTPAAIVRHKMISEVIKRLDAL